jgi:putative ABC transport system permease protein
MNERPPETGAGPEPASRFPLLFENMVQALDRIRAQRLRSTLLILGIAIGVAAIIAMVSLFKGISDQALEEVFASGRPFLTVQKYDFTFGEISEEVLRRPELTPEDARALERFCPSVERVSYERVGLWDRRVVSYRGNRSDPVVIWGTSANLPYFTSSRVTEGRFFTPVDVHLKRRVAVLGYQPAHNLFPGLDPIDREIDLEGRRYRVIGTLEKQSIFGDDNDTIYVPHTSHRRDFGDEDDYRFIRVLARSGVGLAELEEEVVGLLRVRRGVGPGAENDFVLTTSANYERQMSSFIAGVNLAIVGIGLIGLIVGGIGVMNIMLISVTERTYEIGLRKSVGASRGAIMQQFLLEAVGLSCLGGLVGVLVGVGAAWALSRGFHLPLSVSTPWILVAIAFALFAGVLSGVFPAFRAARMDPAEALRKE